MEQLGLARRLFASFHASGIRYCHWKSNEHVEAGLRGETDLDLLIDRSQYVAATRTLLECGFRRVDATPGTRYPGIEDHLGFAPEAGRLLHCHVHFQLVAGEPHLKSYRLPWERLLLERRQWNEEAGIYVAEPEMELLLLLVRYALKLRWRDPVLAATGRRYPGADFLREHRWLLARIDADALRERAEELLGPEASDALPRLLVDSPGIPAFLSFRRAAWARLRQYRRFDAVTARLLRWRREGAWLMAGANRRWLGNRAMRPQRRTLPRGVVVAVIGPDGSGKSSLTRGMTEVFGKKLDVCRVYFGSGDGPSSLVRWPMRMALRFLQRAGWVSMGGSKIAGDGSAPHRSRSRLRQWLRVPWALALASEKRHTLRAVWRARDHGMLVLTDRFPQAQIMGYSDGPLLSGWSHSHSRLLRTIAAWESRPYEWADATPPDLVIRLKVDAAVADARKPETGKFEVARRIEALARLRFGADAQVVDVDANGPLPRVSREVQSVVWAFLWGEPLLCSWNSSAYQAPASRQSLMH